MATKHSQIHHSFFFDNYFIFTGVKKPPVVTRRQKWICAYNPRARKAGQEYSWGLLDHQPNLLGELQARDRGGVRKAREMMLEE